ncbi:MAG TPA: UpxY family transcription antiterminator [Puia sp.]|jgi:transcription antitermination factor NusG|nr:UpxY family transcription antiterminator [Puia sp.]
MNQLKNWYVVYTKPRWEKKVARQLEQKGIEHYCPLTRVQRQWSDRKKIVLEPLFSAYVFVRLEETEQTPVKQTDGVMNFVYWLKKPAVIRDEEIDTIKRFLNEYQIVKLEKSTVNVNDQIRVISGPLMERQGNVLEIRNKTVKVSLPTLGYNIVAEIEKTNIEILSNFGINSNSALAL